jgi:hypothetical protein
MRPPPCQDLVRDAATVVERQALSRQRRPPGYRGARHLAAVIAVSLGPALAALASVGTWGVVPLGAALAAVLVGSTVVYLSHRFPMHRRMRGLELLYDTHTGCHHMMFDEAHTEIASIEDMRMVLLPAAYAAGLCGVLVPLLASPWLWAGWDAALAFAGVTWLYYLAYELVHLLAHLRVGGPWDRVPALGWLLRHHRRHHAWSVMHHANFGMLDPLWDLAMGTRARGPSRR